MSLWSCLFTLMDRSTLAAHCKDSAPVQPDTSLGTARWPNNLMFSPRPQCAPIQSWHWLTGTHIQPPHSPLARSCPWSFDFNACGSSHTYPLMPPVGISRGHSEHTNAEQISTFSGISQLLLRCAKILFPQGGGILFEICEKRPFQKCMGYRELGGRIFEHQSSEADAAHKRALNISNTIRNRHHLLCLVRAGLGPH